MEKFKQVELFFFQEWLDDFLKWNPADFDNITTIVVPGKDIWTPNINILNR